MDLRTLEQALEATLAPHALLTHPFYRAWSEGCLTRGDLALYAEQYRHSVQALPALLEVAEAGTADAATRSSLQRNLDEEEGRIGPAHAALWEQFASAVGAAQAEPLPEIERPPGATEAWGATRSRVAALWAYEADRPGGGDEGGRAPELRRPDPRGAGLLPDARRARHPPRPRAPRGARPRGGPRWNDRDGDSRGGQLGVRTVALPGRGGAHPPVQARGLIC